MTITCSGCAQLAIRPHPAFSKYQNFSSIYQSLGTTSIRGPIIVAISQFNRRNASSSSTQRKSAQNQSIRTKPFRSPSPSSSSSSSSLPLRTKSLASSVNPPSSTLPAKIELPEGETTGSAQSFSQKASRYVKIARAYIGFYKTGLKNAYSNYKDSIPIRRELGLSPFIPTSPVYSARTTPSSGATSLNTAIQSLKITRADFQLVRRAASDLRRLIPFAILLLICGEFTPLVVLAIGDAITPYCCRVPKQLDKTRRMRLERKRAAFSAVQAGLGSMRTIAVGSSEEMTWLAEQFGSREFASTAPVEQVLRACAVFGLTNSTNRGALGAKFIYRPRLQRWTEYLALDDRLILQAGGPEALSAEELQIAVEERGGVGVGADSRPPESHVKIMRQWLKEWFKRRKVELNN